MAEFAMDTICCRAFFELDLSNINLISKITYLEAKDLLLKKVILGKIDDVRRLTHYYPQLLSAVDDSTHWTMIMIAIQYDQVQVAKFLIFSGASLTEIIHGQSALSCAILNNGALAKIIIDKIAMDLEKKPDLVKEYRPVLIGAEQVCENHGVVSFDAELAYANHFMDHYYQQQLVSQQKARTITTMKKAKKKLSSRIQNYY